MKKATKIEKISLKSVPQVKPKQVDFKLIGNETAFSLLEKAWRSGRLAHAFLITGPANIGKTAFAQRLTKLVLGDQTPLVTHPDFMLVERDTDPKTGKPRAIIALEQIQTLCTKLSRRAFLNGWLVAIIKDAQFMNREATNALLKTLEEPHDQILIILTALHADSVLPTIRSRCQEVRLSRVPKKEIEQVLIADHHLTPTEASLLSRLADGCPARAQRYASDAEAWARLRTLREMVLSMIGADYASRWRAIEQLLPKKLSFQEAGLVAQEFLDVAAELLRDALLLRHQQPERIAHLDIADGLRRLVDSNIDLVRACTELQVARQRINENVGPRNALQQFVLVF